MGKNAVTTVSFFSPFLPLAMRINEKNMRQAMLWVCNIVLREGEREFLNKLFKIPLIFCH